MNKTAKKTLKYFLLPQVVPRARSLFGSGFSHIAFFMAQIYRAARLLPAGHAYLLPSNIGRFGVRHVITEAARNLSFRRENSDQILIFMILVLGLGIVFAQICLLFFALFIETANASGFTFDQFFHTQNPDYDVAFMLMDRLFGIPEFFGSCVSQNIICRPGVTGAGDGIFPHPYHIALRGMFSYYSIGLFVIAVLIFMYFVMAVIAETAQSGTPFGKRFNHVWAPIRMVMAFGLLFPVSQGLNSAQWMLLYAAKWGSGFATNGWVLFIDTASETLAGDGSGTGSTILGPPEELIAVPNSPGASDLIQFFAMVATCKAATDRVAPENVAGPSLAADIKRVTAYIVDPARVIAVAPPPLPDSYPEAIEAGGGEYIKINFGYPSEPPEEPECGSLRMNVTVTEATQSSVPGAYILEEEWYNIVKDLWNEASTRSVIADLMDSSNPTFELAKSLGVTAANECEGYHVDEGYSTFSALSDDEGYSTFSALSDIGYCVAHAYIPGPNSVPDAPELEARDLRSLRNILDTRIRTTMTAAVAAQATSEEWETMGDVHGWGGAGLWFNKIAELNGSLLGSVYNVPQITVRPRVTEEVVRKKLKENADVPMEERTNPTIQGQKPIQLDQPADQPYAVAYHQVNFMFRDIGRRIESTGNVFTDTISYIFGLDGLLSMRDNIEKNIHPLATLTATGKSLMESAINSFKITLGASAVGIIGGESMIGKLGSMASGFFSKITTMMLGIGFVLYYIIPFLPFIYFFFAVGAWLKSVLEGMVGVPLWALAHIRIDGNGLPGDAALSGYFMILEIFLRPILIIFGMLASIAIFSAQMTVLNDIWDIVIVNLSGHDTDCLLDDTCEDGFLENVRGSIDQFMYTVIFAVIAYMLGLASFKLVDDIPNHLFRWMGISISSFQETRDEDPAQKITQSSFMGSQMLTSTLSPALTESKNVAKGAKGFAADLAGNNPKPPASDIRVKEDIVYVEDQNGFRMYEFNYIGDDQRYLGVMAQEVEKTHPEAVIEIDGIKRVYYDRLGLEMKKI